MRPSTMRRCVILGVLTLLLGACAGDEAPPTGGITGRVLAGPTCPAETAASPCPPMPWQGTVLAVAVDGSEYRTVAAADGSYSLALPAGAFTVVAETGVSQPPSGVPAEITIEEGAMQQLDLQVDTGIR